MATNGHAEPSTIAALIDDLEGGKYAEDVSAELKALAREIFRQARNVGAASGELTLKIKMTADAGATMAIVGSIADKYPRPVRIKTVRYQGADGELTALDPKQQQLFEERGAPVRVEGERGTPVRVNPNDRKGN